MEVRSALERFVEKVVVDRKTGCWHWSHVVDKPNQYGQFWMDGKHVHAHRAAWELFRGQIPDGQFVLHRCDDKRCVNPSHLFLGTQADNIRDCIGKGRISHGERQWNAKLTNADVEIIRRRVADSLSPIPLSELAQEFGVCKQQISRVILGYNWRHTASTKGE